ncbi:MAG: DUF1292 domain-containing protein [Defluviitaleaceae bacterium]|nr:DUF1292 domain-containing protein [Defluviitaleaceae bacterium]
MNNFNENDFDGLESDIKTITVLDEDGNEFECQIIDTAELNGTNYLLVIENEFADDDECEAVIIKEVSADNEESIFQIVEDDDEFNKIAKLFEEKNVDEYEIEL